MCRDRGQAGVCGQGLRKPALSGMFKGDDRPYQLLWLWWAAIASLTGAAVTGRMCSIVACVSTSGQGAVCVEPLVSERGRRRPGAFDDV